MTILYTTIYHKQPRTYLADMQNEVVVGAKKVTIFSKHFLVLRYLTARAGHINKSTMCLYLWLYNMVTFVVILCGYIGGINTIPDVAGAAGGMEWFSVSVGRGIGLLSFTGCK